MLRKFADRLRSRLAAEQGVALVVSLGMAMTLGIAGTSVFVYSTENQQAAVHSTADQVAYALAEAGLNSASSVVANPNNNPLDPNLLPPRTTTYATGTATWSGTLDTSTNVWTLTSTGEARNPAGSVSNPVRRRVSEKVKVSSGLTAPVVSRAWDYLYTTRTGATCDVNIAAGDVVTAPLWGSNNVCLSAGAKITGGPLVVKNRLTLSGVDSAVGSLTAPISAAHLVGGCKYYVYALRLPCTSADNVFASAIDSVVPAVSPPTVAWDTWYTNANPGPFHGCAISSGSPPIFENETASPTRNNSVLVSFSLTPAVSYTCRVGDASNPTGEISWDAPTRTLTVYGTVFIDGSAKVDNGLVNSYRGQGTLYLSGTFLMTSSSKLCAKLATSGTECDFTGWDPTSAMLAVVANGNGGQVPSGDSVSISASASFEGALYATNAVQFGNYAQFKAPMVAWTILWGSSVQAYPFPSLGTAPSGLPGTSTATARVGTPYDFSG